MGQEKRCKVLILDSDEEVLISLEQLLEDEGIGTTTTWSANQALDLMRSDCFDVVLVGDHLSGCSCEQLLREIQQRGLTASILVMESGERTISGAGYFSSLGAAASVRKREFGRILELTKALTANRLGRPAQAA
jgi:DNA-binding NtrC family response regulator